MSARPDRTATLRLAVAVAAMVVIGAVVNFHAMRPDLRLSRDATKTRAYSLSPQTTALLDTLEGHWTIAVFLVESDADRGLRRQMDEVLGRLGAAAPNLDVVRIDPTDPRTLVAYDAVVQRLLAIYADTTAQYDVAIADGLDAFARLQAFATEQATVLRQVVDAVRADAAMAQAIQPRATQMAILAENGAKLVEAVTNARRVDERRPLPDDETARSILAEALGQWAQELHDTAGIFGSWVARADTDPGLRTFATNAGDAYGRMAQFLAERADPLRHLPPLELSTIARELQTGEVAVVIGPHRAAVVPARQLLPRTNLRQDQRGVVQFDQRFRGEQVLAAAVRSLAVEHMPMVVFVHDAPRSLLRPSSDQTDLFGVASMLALSRYDVREWMVATETAPPEPEPGQASVWVVIPPLDQKGLEPTPAERRLLDATREHLERGGAMVLSLKPSHLPKLGHADPWAALGDALGLTFDTSSIVLEAQRDEAGRPTIVEVQTTTRFTDAHPIGRAVDGLQARFNFPIPIHVDADVAGRVTPLAMIDADPRRWIEDDLLRPRDAVEPPPPDERLDRALPLALAVERTTREGERARTVVVGSMSWMMTHTADQTASVGGDRVALRNPGNHELLLASVAWLAGMDDLIAQSPAGRQIARLDGVTPDVRRRWFWAIVVGLPLAGLALGAVVAVARRR